MKNVKIGVKLIGGFLAVAIVALATGIYLLNSIMQVDEKYTNLDRDATQPMVKIIDQVRLANGMRALAREFILVETREDLNALNKRTADMTNDFLKAVLWQRERVVDKDNITNLDEVKEYIEKYQSKIVDMYNDFLKLPDLHDFEAKASVFNKHSSMAGEYFSKVVVANQKFVDVKVGLAQTGQTETSAFVANMVKACSVLLAIMFLLSLGIGIYMTFTITNSLKKVVKVVSKGESGDMTVRADLNQKDELGVMASQIDKFFASLQNIIKNLTVNSETLAGSSEELSAISRQLASGAEETVNQSTAVASTAEEMSVNINAMASSAEQASVNVTDVASAAEEMSTNMNTISAAIEEMSASISQISANASDARKVASDATTKSEEATNVMNVLGNAAREIGQVTDVIKSIADKTNLLALNATIEAASAGEAGKGFAVVAGEIKELANQSAQSADDIARRIEGIQQGTNNAVNVISDVNDIIFKISSSIESIAGYVEQQTKASNEIANNVFQASSGSKRVASAIGEVAKGASDVSRNASEAAKGAANVSQSVISMNQAAKESAQGATQVNQSAGDLAKIADELKLTIANFKV